MPEPVRRLLLASLAAAALSSPALAGEAPTPGRFGAELEIAETTPIPRLLSEPAKWDGKAVRVEGTVRDVCPKKGCWMTLTAGDATVRIKVDDGVIVFPKDAKGKVAVAEGVVRVRELDRESWIAWERHLAEEKGEEYDATGVGEGPFRLVQIEGRGAEIRGL